jgi:hypothetical protein
VLRKKYAAVEQFLKAELLRLWCSTLN